MKKLLLVLCISVFSLSVFAQTEKGYVYLKNGSILKGKYAFFDDGQKIRIESAGNVWIFNADEVDRIESRKASEDLVMAEPEDTSKVFFRSEMGVLVGNPDNSQNAPFSLTGSVNYLVNPNFSAGIGFGVEFLKESYMPVFANFEYRFWDRKTSPYLFVKAGYQIPLEDANEVYYDVIPVWSSWAPWPGEVSESGFDAKGGVLINPGVGFQQMFSHQFGMTFAVGYQFHRLNYEGENSYSLDIDYNRVTVKIGLIFN